MIRIENESQYEWAVARVEELLPLVNDTTPETYPNYIELVLFSNLAADYSEEHYSEGKPSHIDVIKLRIFKMGLTQAALAKLIGVSPSRSCDYLIGKANRC